MKLDRMKNIKSIQNVRFPNTRVNRKENNLLRSHDLVKIASYWDHTIRLELSRIARHLWPNIHLFGLIPINNYRLRKQNEADKIVWWIEHDIPPYDRYRCEAYRVELSLSMSDRLQLVVRSGTSAYKITPLTKDGLKASLIQAGADTPLIIRRRFESASDP